MKLIVCIDEKKGMLFNNRRQSRDSKVVERIIEITKDKNLWITNFSKNLFLNYNVNIEDNFLDKIGEEDYIFLENVELEKVIDKVSEIIIFNWNRHYPADMYFTIPLDNFVNVSEKEFVGTSHEKITEVVYERKKL